MAVSSPQSGSDQSLWWSSWISSAREKSVSALNATKRDLAEFVSVLGADTKAVVKGASNNINKMLIQPDSASGAGESEGGRNPVIEPQAAAPYDRCQAELFAIQNSTETYLQSPPQGTGDFEMWKSTFDIQSYQSDISNLLVSSSLVRTRHSELVPAKVSYEAFWMRYFYRMYQLEEEKRQRADLMARASNRSQEQLQWDEELEDVMGTPLVLKVDACGHQRSESSTDSFVCVSEETGLEGEGPPSRGMPESESWELLGSELGGSGSRDSRAKLSEMGEEEASSDEHVLSNLLQKDPSLLQSIEVITIADVDKGKREREEDADSNSSGWENWDD